jgi:hypothetical protein
MTGIRDATASKAMKRPVLLGLRSPGGSPRKFATGVLVVEVIPHGGRVRGQSYSPRPESSRCRPALDDLIWRAEQAAAEKLDFIGLLAEMIRPAGDGELIHFC